MGMSLPNKKTRPLRAHGRFEGQENPVPTTETLTGEITMDPDAEAPAQDALEHLDALDSSASRSSVSWSDEENSAVDNNDSDDAEVGD